MWRPEMSYLTRLGLTVAGVVLAAAPAAAQVFAGTAIGAGVAMPDSTAPRQSAPVAAISRVDILRHLPSTYDGLRLSGESGDLGWPVYLTSAQAAAPIRFRIGYVSAVSILPDASRLSVRINDKEIGGLAIDAAQGLRTVEFAVPPGLAQAGYNAVSVSVSHRHRVDCSVPATYELWTRIDPQETGLVLGDGSSPISDTADMAALALKPDGSLPIHVLLAGKTRPAHVERLIRATQSIAITGHFQQPLVDFDQAVEDAYGVDLAVGTRALLVGLPRLVGSLGVAGPLVRVLPGTAGTRPTLIVTGSTDAEVDEALATLSTMAPATGSPQGLMALATYPAFPTEGDASLRLRDLGLHSEEFAGRFFRKSFNLSLPADFLASDYGRGTFDLAGGYAAGLTRDAQVRVDVNGKSSGIIKLPRSGGDTFRHNHLFLPLGLMRPGLNRIDIFAETPRPDDATCEATDGKRFLLLESTEVHLPVLARVERLPDLAATTAGGLPFTRGNAHLVVPKPDRQTMGGALSLTARAAVAANRVLPFSFSTKMPDTDDGSTLVVAPARALDPALMTATGLDPADVEAAWRDLAVSFSTSTSTSTSTAAGLTGRWWIRNEDGPAACRLPSQIGAAAPARVGLVAASKPVPMREATAAAPVVGDDLLETWNGDTHPRSDWLVDLRGWSARTMRSTLDWIDAVPAAVRVRFGGATHRDGITANTSLILAQGMSVGSTTNVTTIVTAPDAATLRAAMPCLFDPGVWSRVHGRLAALDASNGEVTATDATSFRYVGSSKRSIGNARLVLAGWFSLDPVAFVVVAMIMALWLSGATVWFVRGVGRRSE